MLSCAVAAIMTSGATAAMAADAGTRHQQYRTSCGDEADRRSDGNTFRTCQARSRLFPARALSDLNLVNFDSLLKYTPNVTYGNNGPGQGEIIMRGLSNGFRGNQSSGTIGNFPNVAIYLDDQSMQFPARNNDIYLVDLERVEVLEGPQGTLFWRGGAEAGALRYITNKPNLDSFQGKAEASYGFTSGGADNDPAQRRPSMCRSSAANWPFVV